MAHIHDEADEIAEEQVWQAMEEEAVRSCDAALDWVVEASMHLLAEHDLTDHERVQVVHMVLDATLEKIQLLELRP